MRHVRTYHSAEASEEVTVTSSGGGASVLVAASDAHPLIKARADFICDGVDDQVEINQAADLDLVVQLSPGTFSVSATVFAPFLRGCGTNSTFVLVTGAWANGSSVFGGWDGFRGSISDFTVEDGGFSGGGVNMDIMESYGRVERVGLWFPTYVTAVASGIRNCKVVSDCHIIGTNGYFAIMAGFDTATVEHCLIEDCEAQQAIYAIGADQAVKIVNNHITCSWPTDTPYDFTGGIVALVNDDTTQIMGNQVFTTGVGSSNAIGIYVVACANATVSCNHVEDAVGIGLALYMEGDLGSEPILVQGNSVILESNNLGSGLVGGEQIALFNADFCDNYVTGNFGTPQSADGPVIAFFESRLRRNNIKDFKHTAFFDYGGGYSSVIEENILEPESVGFADPMILITPSVFYPSTPVMHNLIIGGSSGWTSVVEVESAATNTKIIGNRTVGTSLSIPLLADSGTGTTTTWPNDVTNGDNWV